MKKIALVCSVGLLSVLAGCGKPFLSTLKPAGEVGKSQYHLMLLSLAIMLLVLVVVFGLFTIVMLRFRRKHGDDQIPEQVEGNHKLEVIWTVIPILLLIVLAVPTVFYTYKFASTPGAAAKAKDAVVVDVRSNQYWWEFSYPNAGIITSQELVVPTGQKIYFKLHSSDVKHSFWIPSAGGKIDTNVEGTTEFWLSFDPKKAEEAGEIFYGKCAELCGPSHAFMDFKVRTLPKDEYLAWVKAMKNTANSDSAIDPAIAAGKSVFDNSCIGCHAVSAVDQRPEAARLAPNLANFGNKLKVAGVLDNTEENVQKWLKDPEAIKPGNEMTGKYGELSDEEIASVTKYLESLKAE